MATSVAPGAGFDPATVGAVVSGVGVVNCPVEEVAVLPDASFDTTRKKYCVCGDSPVRSMLWAVLSVRFSATVLSAPDDVPNSTRVVACSSVAHVILAVLCPVAWAEVPEITGGVVSGAVGFGV